NIYVGCNVENAAYPVGNCAEPSAIAAMLAGGGKRIRRVYTTGPGAAPVTPCGGCRQRIREFADQDVVVVSHGIDGAPLEQTIAQLLPHSFGPEFLGR
ncbi:MAG: cytidine deaminase, partial [Hyphomicrobiales bacterium]